MILWTALVRYRLRILNGLISSMNTEQFEQIEHQASHNNTNSSSITAEFDANTFGQIDIIHDLYNRMWIQTNLINVRFKYSMVLHIGSDFGFLVANTYFSFLCSIKYSLCHSFPMNVVGIIVSIFHVLSLCVAGQNMTNEASQIAYGIHRNRHARRDMASSSFVRVEHFLHLFLSRFYNYLYNHGSQERIVYFVLDQKFFISIASPKSATQCI